MISKYFKSEEYIFNIFWPIAISMFLQTVIALIDTLILSYYSIDAFTGVSVASQVTAIIGPMYFGVLSALSIYTSQSIGNNDSKRIRQIFGLGIIIMSIMSIVSVILMVTLNDQIIGFYAELNSVMGANALIYLNWTMPAKLFWPISMLFMFQFRAIKETKIPMYINSGMLVLNSVLSLILVYGIGFFPELGIIGVAVATDLSIIGVVIVYIYVCFKKKIIFFNNFADLIDFDYPLLKKILIKAAPLVLVEFLFGFARTLYIKMYIDYSPIIFALDKLATSIVFTINGLVMGTAASVGVVFGEALGKDSEETLEKNRKMSFSFIKKMTALILIISICILPLFILLFQVEDLKSINNYFLIMYCLIIINGIYMSIRIWSSSFVSILRSGGDTNFIILADPISSYLVGLPLTFIAIYFLDVNFLIIKSLWITEVVGKLLISYYRYKQKKWMRKV